MPKLTLDPKLLSRLKPSKNHFLTLATSVINQQISTKAAAAIFKRFKSLFGRKKPSPELLLAFSETELREIGLSRQKIVYLRDLAEKFIDKTIDPKKFPKMTDEEIREHLMEVKGIGRWTADMFLIFALNRPNVLPVGDLVIVKGFQKVFKLKRLPDEKRMRSIAKEYEGEHTHLSLHLWAVFDDGSVEEIWG